MRELAIKIVDSLMIDWWKESVKDFFTEKADFLLSKGLTEDEIYNLLRDLYYIVSEEYGR